MRSESVHLGICENWLGGAWLQTGVACVMAATYEVARRSQREGSFRRSIMSAGRTLSVFHGKGWLPQV